MRKKKTQETKVTKCFFKKRNDKKKNKIKLVYGQTGLMSRLQQRVEGFFVLKFKLKIRKAIKKKKKQHRPSKCKFSYWIKYNPNVYLTKKSKNARMGSGKGKFVRKAFNLVKNKSFIELKRIKFKWTINMKNYFWNKYNIDLYCYKESKTKILKYRGVYI